MAHAFNRLQTLEQHFAIFSQDFTPEHIMEFIALMERVKIRLQAAIPLAHQRRRARVRLIQRGRQAQRATEDIETHIDWWIKKTEKPPRVLKISELKQPAEEPCGICLENHTGEEMVACGCKHRFGKNCFLLMARTNLSSSIPVVCPLCRVPVKTFSGFRPRAAPKPRNPIAA
jgi:hypothetical protein